MKSTGFWLLKTEPSTYSYQDLQRDRKTGWDGVRNFQARNFLGQAKKGDLALIYHSVSEKAVVGVAKVVREAYPDPDPKKKGEWVQIDIQAVKPLQSPVTLEQIKTKKTLADLPLLKQSRLSVMPVARKHYETILRMGQ